jgi:hypothetical protein
MICQQKSSCARGAFRRQAGKTRNRPYLLNGDPVAVQITVNVIFALGG